MVFCKHRDLFGKPGQGVHSHRFMGVAIVDMLLTVIVAKIVSFYVSKKYSIKMSFVKTLAAFLFAGVLVHRLFCVNTTVNVAIFGTV
ncbi:MAG: hypothetical protein EBU90_01830 [Proteobacteria bacterium]|nr:hypothetical protein [Pseudomonadota bacterium]NBP13220.1 hypothetical protein [bacterium]